MSFRLAILPFLLSSTAARAQEAPRPDVAAPAAGDDIVVSANRAPVAADLRLTALRAWVCTGIDLPP